MRALLSAVAAVSVVSATVALLAAAVPAQGGYDLDKQTAGTLGKTLSFAFAGANPQKTLLFMLSVNAGPTPLSLLQPSDPRVLSVGLELGFAWYTLPTGAGGSGTTGIPVPNNIALSGKFLYFQSLTAPGASLIVDQVSNGVKTQLGAADRPLPLGAALGAARALAATFANGKLNAGAGDVVVAGGGQGTLLGATGLQSSEIYDFRTMTVRPGPGLSSARALTIAVTLNDGRVLLSGGVDNLGAVLATCEIYDPVQNAFTSTGSMAVARAAHDGVLLADGRVLVAGGTTTFSDAVAALANAQSTAEIWNPATGSWTTVRAMQNRLLAPDLTTLNDGRVLVSGGFQVLVIGFPIPVGSITACQLYTPASNTWSAAGSMKSSRGAHGPNTVLLGDGRVLVTGGATSGPVLTSAAPIQKAETYDPATNSWTGLPDMAMNRALHSATLLPNGRVLVAGGADGTLTAPIAHQNVQELDPATNTWRPLPNLGVPRAGHAAAVTPDGLVVLLGGQSNASTTLSSCETIHY